VAERSGGRVRAVNAFFPGNRVAGGEDSKVLHIDRTLRRECSPARYAAATTGRSRKFWLRTGSPPRVRLDKKDLHSHRPGGGTGRLGALSTFGVPRVVAVEVNPIIATDIMRGTYASWNGDLYRDPASKFTWIRPSFVGRSQ